MSPLPTLAVVKKDPLLRFLLTGLLLFAGWLLLYHTVLHPYTSVDRVVIDNIMLLAGATLTGLGEQLLPEPDPNYRTIGVQGGSDLWIGDPCNGVMVMAVFAIFIMAYPGTWRSRAWFIPLGILSIHLINTLRVVVLVLVARKNYQWLSFNHDFVFYVVVYGWVFLLWWIWVKRLAWVPGRSAA
jgi:exosortase family protein XrtF